eukprot:scpid34430/ scgid4741/ Probable ATP-dependent RNA helicase DDX31; DEAD box protein 31; Helicain
MDDDDGIVLNLSAATSQSKAAVRSAPVRLNKKDARAAKAARREQQAAYPGDDGFNDYDYDYDYDSGHGGSSSSHATGNSTGGRNGGAKFLPKTDGTASPGSNTGYGDVVRGKDQARAKTSGFGTKGKTGDGGGSHAGHSTNKEKTKPSEVISSLFKGNPAIPAAPDKQSSQLVKKQATKKRAVVGEGVEVFNQAKTFEELGIIHRMIANLDSTLHMSKPTGVQSVSIPLLLEGHDCLVQSQTGSGKTLAYSLPLVQRLSEIEPKIDRNGGPYAFVLLPTRELALQSFEVLQKACKCCCWVVPGCITGGEKKKAEKARIRKGLNIIVATPGRLLDHIQNTNSFLLSNVRWLVLDEADRLLDLGFEKDLAAIIEALDKAKTSVRRQSVLLSATLSSGVERLASISLQEPKYINMRDLEQQGGFADGAESTYHTPSTLTQHYLFVPSKVRLVALAAFLRVQTLLNSDGKVIVFLSSRDSVDFHHGIMERLFDQLADEDESLSRATLLKLHGNMGQTDRVHVFDEFRKSSVGVLFCTDVGARGLDLPQVSWIVQYTPPCTVADYVHRIGRTARIGLSGKALLFLLPSEAPYRQVLEESGLSLTDVTVNSLLRTLVKGKDPTDFQVEAAATDLQLSCERFVTADNDLKELASDACLSYVRAYTTYPASLKHIFHRRALHLGHVAKSFSLRSTPSQIASSGQVRVERKRKKQVDAEHSGRGGGGGDSDDGDDDDGDTETQATNSRYRSDSRSDAGVFKKKRRVYVPEHDSSSTAQKSRFAGPMPGKKKKKGKK